MANDTVASIKQQMLSQEEDFVVFQETIAALKKEKSALIETMVMGENLEQAEELKRSITGSA